MCNGIFLPSTGYYTTNCHFYSVFSLSCLEINYYGLFMDDTYEGRAQRNRRRLRTTAGLACVPIYGREWSLFFNPCSFISLNSKLSPHEESMERFDKKWWLLLFDGAQRFKEARAHVKVPDKLDKAQYIFVRQSLTSKQIYIGGTACIRSSSNFYGKIGIEPFPQIQVCLDIVFSDLPCQIFIPYRST